MKILEQRYPKGAIPNQKTAGRYIDETLYQNIKILAKNIVRDMTFLGVISSSTLEVGSGKSVLVQQIAEAYLEAVREFHRIDNQLSMKNITFSPRELIDKAFQVPKYSVIILDEWEDLNYWSELGMSLRQFFRKCRQLNLFMLVIIPNFFQLPLSYAVSRSVFFIDVKFSGEFERGYFRFFSFNKKKELYLKGKKTQDYNCVKPDFMGRFADGYVIDEATYRRVKYLDMLKWDKEESKPLTEKQIRVKLFKQIYQNLDKISIKELSKGFGVSERTGSRWTNASPEEDKDNKTISNTNLINDEDNPIGNLTEENPK